MNDKALWRATFSYFALAGLLCGAARAATPPAGTVSGSSTQASWSGGPKNSTAASTCGGPSNPACDNYKLTIAPPAYSFQVVITLTPQLADDYDLEVYGPDGALLDGSGNAAGTTEQVTLVNPAAGTYTVSALPFAAAMAYSATAGLAAYSPPPPPPPTPRSTATPPTYANYVPPPGMGTDAAEPSVGFNPKSGAVMFVASTQTLRVNFDQCPSPAKATWTDVSFLTTSKVTFDPILFTDRDLGRTFVSQLLPIKESLTAFSDDDGETWTPSQGAGIGSGVDHQTIGGGPFASGLLQPLTSYQHSVFFCSQDDAEANCASSVDGGLTFGPAVPMYTLLDCGGLHGHVKVGPDGTAYVPNPSCGGGQGVLISHDNGLTWAVHHLPGSVAAGSDPSVAIATDGTVYVGWIDGDKHPFAAVSHDRGETWTEIHNVGLQALGIAADIENGAFPAMVAGDPDRAALAFLGTPTAGDGAGDDPNFPAVWHLYVAHTYDGGRSWVTVDATPNDPVQRGTVCQGGTLGCNLTRNLLDFNDATLDSQGRVIVAYADGCVGSCVQGPPNSGSDLATIARQASGKGLYAAFDAQATGGPPASPALDATWVGSAVHLAWSTPDDHGSAITGYRIYRRSGGGALLLLASVAAGVHAYDDRAVVASGSYGYRVTAVNARGESTPCADVVPVVPDPATVRTTCVPPGPRVIVDPTGDAPVSALDVETLSVAEPSFDDGSHKLVFTLKVHDLQNIAPGNAWMVLWNRPVPDASFDRNYVVMRATGLGTASFKYGHISPPNVNQGTDLGDADGGSFSTDGTITIAVATDKVDGVHEGQDLSTLQVRTFAANASGMPVSQNSAVDYSPESNYTLRGTAICANRAPVAVDDAATTQQNKPVKVDVLANDSDPDGDRLTVVALGAAAHGKVVGKKGGTVSYKPDNGFTGTDRFPYTIDDGHGHTATGNVTVTVTR
jgi:Big-like domain-containing protein